MRRMCEYSRRASRAACGAGAWTCRRLASTVIRVPEAGKDKWSTWREQDVFQRGWRIIPMLKRPQRGRGGVRVLAPPTSPPHPNQSNHLINWILNWCNMYANLSSRPRYEVTPGQFIVVLCMDGNVSQRAHTGTPVWWHLPSHTSQLLS